MSRHRFVKNLTEDDMYDDWDDEDYYDEEDEDDEYYYQQQQQQRRQQQQSASLFSSAKAKQKQKSTPTKNKSSPPSEEQVRLVMGMGFSRQQAEQALKQSNNVVEDAVTLLLSSTSEKSTGTGAVAISKNPPPGFGPPPSTTTVGSSISKAPPGFGGPPSASSGGISKPPAGFGGPPPSIAPGGITKPPAGFGGPPPQSPATFATSKNKAVATSTPTKTKSATSKQQQSTKESDKNDDQSTASSSIPPHVIQKLQAATKSQYSMVVLGHVDAGKSTLMGQLLLQTNHVSQRLVSKLEKEASQIGKGSFALAWVLDSHENERERGVTMEIAMKALRTTKRSITILDAPGHAELVPTMMTGTAMADVGLLVVSAPPSEFEAGFGTTNNKSNNSGATAKGQTREHVTLARGLGVGQLVVAVNKMDLVGYSQQRFDEICRKLKPFLKQVGFLPKRTTFVPVSGYNGINIMPTSTTTNTKNDKKLPKELASWYKDGKPSLLDALNNVDEPYHIKEISNAANKPLRCIIMDVYREGKYVLVQCRVVQGTCQVGEKLLVNPMDQQVQLSRMEHPSTASMSMEHVMNTGTSDDDSSSSVDRTKYAIAGDLPTFSLVGMDAATAQRLGPGQVLSHVTMRPPISRKAQVQLVVLELSSGNPNSSVPIIRGAQLLLHMHSMDLPVIVSKLQSVTPKGATRPVDKPRILSGGSHAIVELLTKRPICIDAFEKCRALGRVVLRRGGRTVAMGIVEKVLDYN